MTPTFVTRAGTVGRLSLVDQRPGVGAPTPYTLKHSSRHRSSAGPESK